MSPVTYISIEAQMQDISLRNRKATASLEAMLDQQPKFGDQPPPPPNSPRMFLTSLIGLSLGAGVVLLAGLIFLH